MSSTNPPPAPEKCCWICEGPHAAESHCLCDPVGEACGGKPPECVYECPYCGLTPPAPIPAEQEKKSLCICRPPFRNSSCRADEHFGSIKLDGQDDASAMTKKIVREHRETFERLSDSPSPAPTVQRENSVGGTISVPCVFPASGVVVATEDNSKTVSSSSQESIPALPGAVGASVAPAPQRGKCSQPEAHAAMTAIGICPFHVPLTSRGEWPEEDVTSSEGVRTVGLKNIRAGVDKFQSDLRASSPAPQRCDEQRPQRGTEEKVQANEIFERINGEYVEIGAPDDCEACARLEELGVDVPICFVHRTPSRCGDCATHPILQCPTCDDDLAAQLATIREQRDEWRRLALIAAVAGGERDATIAELREEIRLLRERRHLWQDQSTELATATSRLRQCEEDLKEINTQAVKYAEDYPFITPHASGPQHVDNVVRFSLFIAALAAPAPDVLDKKGEK